MLDILTLRWKNKANLSVRTHGSFFLFQPVCVKVYSPETKVEIIIPKSKINWTVYGV